MIIIHQLKNGQHCMLANLIYAVRCKYFDYKCWKYSYISFL